MATLALIGGAVIGSGILLVLGLMLLIWAEHASAGTGCNVTVPGQRGPEGPLSQFTSSGRHYEASFSHDRPPPLGAAPTTRPSDPTQTAPCR